MTSKSEKTEVDKQLNDSRKEIKEEVKKADSKGKFKEDDSEPKLYHYLVVLGIFFAIFFIIYLGFELFYVSEGTPGERGRFGTYIYEFDVMDKSGTMEFYNPIDIIEKLNYPIQVSKYDVLDSKSVVLAFGNYTGTDNGEVVRASGRFIPFFSGVYGYEIDPVEDLYREDDLNCDNSTIENKVVIFNPYGDKTGVFMSENGCIMFLADDPLKMGGLGDKFYYAMIQE